MDDWLSDFDRLVSETQTAEEEAPPVEVISGGAPLDKPKSTAAIAKYDNPGVERLMQFESKLYQDSIMVLESALAFAEVSEDEGVPPAWVEKYGQRQAEIRYRIALAAQLNSKNAPVALKLAAQLNVGLVKAQSLRDLGDRVLNFQVVNITAPIPSFPVQEHDDD